MLIHTGEKTQMLTDKKPKMLSHSGGIPQIWKVSKSQQTIVVTVLLFDHFIKNPLTRTTFLLQLQSEVKLDASWDIFDTKYFL